MSSGSNSDAGSCSCIRGSDGGISCSCCCCSSNSGGNGEVCMYVFVERAIVKSSPEIVRSSLLPFFTFAADDLAHTVSNLKVGRFSHVKGTITRGISYR